jgi:hypothetical protein
MNVNRLPCLAAVLLHAVALPLAAADARFASHPPMRPLPVASQRPLATAGPSRFVDPHRGSDDQDGTAARPWKSLGHAAEQLRPGDTLYLRGGTYYEHVALTVASTAEKPITIRAYPGELAILDGGLREFFESPAQAWEPCPDGVPGEYRSVKTYPDLGGAEGQTNVLGNFGDSMVPLHGYRFRTDLQSDNPYWNISSKVQDQQSVYCGPGIYYDAGTGRIHARLVHTRLPGLHEDNYRGETDPRKLRLVIAGRSGGPILTLRDCRHVRLQDLVLRGARTSTLEITGCANIELDGLTVYGGQSAVQVRDTVGLRMAHTACRGIAAPWTFRGSLKYRAIEARIFSASGWDPTGADSRDFELAWCEFTDCVDGVFLGNVHRVRFHHNLLDNVSDDGIFLTAGTAYDGTTHGGDVHIYQNHLARCLTTFAFGVGHGRQRAIEGGKQTGSGVYIYRNVFDFRRPVMYQWPSGPDAPQEISSYGRVASDHGGPAWEPMWIYHNTILAGDPPRYDYGTDGLGKAMGHGTSRRVFNNIICQLHGMPGESLPPATADYQADGNLLWSVSDGPGFTGELFAKFRRSPAFEESKSRYAPGWTAHDQFADPQFVRFSSDWRSTVDLGLKPASPAVNAGVTIPSDWPDPLRDLDARPPDLGAVPSGTRAWRVGVNGRLAVSGWVVRAGESIPQVAWAITTTSPPARADRKPAALVLGYPAFDAPLLEFALRRQGVRVDVLERTWLDPREYGRYSLVAVDGSLVRGKVEPNRLNATDLASVKTFLEQGGTLLLMRERTDLFGSPEGQQFLLELTGGGPRQTVSKLSIQQPQHPWVKHLSAEAEYAWLDVKLASLLRASRGENIVGANSGASLLYRLDIGQGQLIYLGWSPARWLPNGRLTSAVQQEQDFEAQMGVLRSIIADLYPR